MLRVTAQLGVVVAALTAAAGATGTPERAAGTLQVDGTLTTSRTLSAAYCPPATSASSICARYIGDGSIPGLGHVTSTYTKVITMGDAACEVRLLGPVIEAPGKGILELSRPGKTCWPFAIPITVGPFDFTVTEGSGTYSGATGSLTFKSNVFVRAEGVRGASLDTWAGTIAVPGVEFDVSPPTISGAASKTVRASKRAKRVRVRYSVTAEDAVDGSVPVVCSPRSGSVFALGRTAVACTAADSSGNTSQARFTITVRRGMRR